MNYSDFFSMLESKIAIKNSFIYCDPPYLPEDNCVTKRIDIYTKDSFDHISFFNTIKKLNTNVMISLARTEKSDEIYLKDKFSKRELSTIIRTVNPKKIFSSEEIAYINYKIDPK